MSKRIAFMGDSITDACRNRQSQRYCGSGYALIVRAKMGSRYPEKYEFMNCGYSGARSVDFYANIKRWVIDVKPDMMSLLLGVNDVYHDMMGPEKNGVSAEKFEQVMDLLLTEIRETLPDTRLMLLEPFLLEADYTKPREGEPDRYNIFRSEVEKRAAAVRRLAAKHHLPFVPLQAKLDAAAEQYGASTWLYDGIHPSAAGHELIAREWIAAYEKYFMKEDTQEENAR